MQTYLFRDDQFFRIRERCDPVAEGVPLGELMILSRVIDVHMLSAVRPYANHQEQEMIDMMTRFLETRKGAANAGVTPDQLLALLPPDVKNQFETLQMVIQSFAPGGSA